MTKRLSREDKRLLSQDGPSWDAMNAEAELARMDAIHGIFAQMPSPKMVAHQMHLLEAEILAQAIQGQDGAFRIKHEHQFAQRELALMGLVEIQGPYLTCFGNSVRKVLKEQMS